MNQVRKWVKIIWKVVGSGDPAGGINPRTNKIEVGFKPNSWNIINVHPKL